MNGTAIQAGYRPAEERTSVKTMTGGAILESLGGIAVIALAIVGLAGVFTTPMAAIATIVLGAAVLIEGGAFAASHQQVMSQSEATQGRSLVWSEGLSAEFPGAVAGIVLGILALLGAAPVTLVSVAAIVLGATFMCSGLTELGGANRTMFGVAGFVLGILAVCGLASLTLVLVALLSLGAATLFGGAATGTRMAVATSH